MSPFTINLILWIHTRPKLSEFEGFNSIAYHESMRRLVNEGIIDRADFPRITTKGEAWIKMILATPFPELVWLDPRTKEAI